MAAYVFPGSMAYSFLRDDDIVESRDPENGGVGGVRLNYLRSHDVALSHCLRDGMILILDTKASTSLATVPSGYPGKLLIGLS